MASNNIGIERVGYFVPADRVDAIELGKQLDAKEDFVREKLGFLTLAKKKPIVATSDLCVEAYKNMVKQMAAPPEVGCLMVVTQNPDTGGIPHTSAIVHHKLGLSKRIACCDISLGCTGFVHAVSVMIGFMRENEIENGLLFTADPYSEVIDTNDRDTAMLFGDGAACTLISTNPRFTLGKSRFVTGSKFHNAIKTSDDSTRTLSMVGSEVFRFVAKNVPKEIKDCLTDNQISLEQVDRFLIHQGSKFIVETLATALKVDSDRLEFTAGDIGNTVSSSIPIMLAKVLEQDEVPKNILMAGFGVGLSSFISTLHRVD